MHEEDEDQDEQDNGEQEAPEPLTHEVLSEKLSLLCKTGSGLAHAYVRADLQSLSLGDVSVLSTFVHLRYLDVSNNKISDISCLNNLSQLIVLKADHNLLQSASIAPLAYLQVLNLAHNNITTTEGITHPLLENLDLSFNQITELSDLSETNLPTLTTLDCHGNALTGARNINIPTLQKLYLATNQINTLEGLGHLTQLTTLHLRENQLKTLDGLTEQMSALQYINLRGNPIEDIKEVAKLQCLPFLRALILSECPVCETDEYRLEVLIAIRTLERLDKDVYEQDERQDAEEMAAQRQPVTDD
ncbi:leucine-rich repeat-containing protein 23-like [Dysidea avara]|uniref:leucine-rich repeat-containing protein 23-like n=1 Tax=Dysidea avara TaxID=196820 RepID=UPI00331AFC2B